MRHFVTLFLSLLFSGGILAQCSPAANAVNGPILIGSPNGTFNRSGIAFNPIVGLYYSVDAGNPSFPVDTYNAAFALVNTIPEGFDYRGAWWNNSTGQFEGNGYNGFGIFVQNLDGGALYPLGSGNVILPAGQPDDQAAGAFDGDSDQIIYYFNGAIYRYARATNAAVDTLSITGLPVPFGSLNTTSVAYTGCPGYEYVVYDYVGRQVLFVNEATGAYTGSCQLPANAMPRSFLGMAYANNYFWLFDNVNWQGYEVISDAVSVADGLGQGRFEVYPNPASDMVSIVADATVASNVGVEVLDAAGRRIPCGQIRSRGGSTVLDVSGMSSGAYVLRISVGGTLEVRQLMVER